MFATRSGFHAWQESLDEIIWWEDICPDRAYHLLKIVLRAVEANSKYYVDGFDRAIELTDIYKKCKIVDALSEDYYEQEN
jgi:hypothetical protein